MIFIHKQGKFLSFTFVFIALLHANGRAQKFNELIQASKEGNRKDFSHLVNGTGEKKEEQKKSQGLKLANIFTDNMVIQQNMKVPVWGTASPGEKISIDFLGKTTKTKADKKGNWILKLPEQKAGGPFSMKIKSSGNLLELKNVLVGEVWLASGQSNMAWNMERSSQAAIDIPAANFPEIRLLTVPLSTSPKPVEDIGNTKWELCTPSSIGSFSAVAYYFAREIYRTKNVPVGVISASLGSSAAESWTSRNMLEEMPEFREKLLKMDTDTARWNEKVAKIKKYETEERRAIAIAAAEGLKQGAHLPDYDDKGWKTSTFPMNMRKLGLPGYWGFVWFRKEFDLSEDQAKKDLKMELPISCDEFLLYFNGVETGGRIYKQPLPTSYVIPKDRIKPGRNLISIRMRTYFGGGSIGTEDSNSPEIVSSDNTVHIPIAGEWKFNAAIEPKIYPNQEYFNTPTVLYNGMISPIIPYAMKGVIWYQGETNASRPIEYRTLFPSLIKDWRKKWDQGDFPFLFVQLASRKREGVADLQYALVREAQTYALKLPNTAMATAVDLGEKNETHPKNKKDVGLRLALAALKTAYNQDIVYSGPVYKSMKVDGNSIRVSFTETGTGLIVKGQDLKGFKIAGSDQKFHLAKAIIDGNEVVVSSPLVPEPKAVRYCFESWCEGNLSNQEGIGAPQFRTDDWEVITNSK